MTKKTYHAFSKKALNSDTPMWAKNMFRITFVFTSAITIFIAGTNLFTEDIKYECMLGLKALDAIIYGLSKMFGVSVKEEE
jgi:isochorismate hydrolase